MSSWLDSCNKPFFAPNSNRFFDLRQQQGLAQIMFVELQDLMKSNKVRRTQMILEDECMVLMEAAFWHLTCCIVQGTSVSLLLPS